jgi:hypothetical protein
MKFSSHILLIIALYISLLFSSSDLIKYPNEEDQFKIRWNWAKTQAQNIRGGYWIGYCIERLMSPHSYIGCHGYHDQSEMPTLEMIIQRKSSDLGGDIDTLDITQSAQRALHRLDDSRESIEKIVKKVAILFNFSIKPTIENIKKIKISNLSLFVDLEKQPLIWIGLVDMKESLEFMIECYENTSDIEIKEELITVISLHQGMPATFSFLRQVIESDEDDDLREKAVFWLGQQHTPEALEYLVLVVKTDRSINVREEAVFAVSQLDSEQATDELINLAKNEKNYHVRKKAIFWLGQKASRKAKAALEGFVYNNSTIEIKKQAVFALSQLADQEGVPALIKIAKTHPINEVRKKAIFWLGQSDDPRALDAIIEIVQGE